jgi:uncharacterized membrane protein YgcG
MVGRLAWAAFALLAALTPADAEERIQRFVSDVLVQRNGDLLVTETIVIRAEGRQIKRGILRDFPTTYRRADGSRVEVGFDVQVVLRDGATETFSTERMANGVRVRIGRGDRTVNPGLHQYVIRYRTTRQIGFFRNYDELYWNATGTGWTFPIDVAEARINLPEPVAFTQSALYTGPQGARGKDAVVVEQAPGRIVFRTTKALPVANGLTVAAAWPKGVVVEPTRAQQIEAMLKDDPALLTATIGGGLVIAYYLLAWLLVGRDPPRGTIIPLFAPPKGMSAAAVRFVHEMSFDDRVFAAAIVGLGVNGRLRLIDHGRGGKEVHHLKGNAPIDAAERVVETTLFARRSKVSLKNSEHELIGEVRHALHMALQRLYFGTLFRNHVWWSSFGLVAAVLATTAICLSYADSYGANVVGILAGLFLPIIPVMIGVGMIRKGWRSGGRGMTGLYIGIAVVAIAVAIGVAILAYNIGFGLAILPALVPSLLAAFVARGFSWLRAPTRAGRGVMDEIEGFRQYLGVAEEDRLEHLNPPEKTPELFEKFLPYAIALNVENSWANRFTGVLAAAGVAAAVSSWYSGDHGSSGDIVSFADRIGDSLSTTIASAATPPGSSGGGGGDSGGGGSSGGGSSGGGGGGGGGSGW